MRTIHLLLAALGLMLAGGCAGSTPPGVPGGSRLVGEGGGPIEFVAPADGTVFLRDLQHGDTSSVAVKSGQRVAVDPRAGRLTLNGQPVVEFKAGPAARCELYYKEKAQREYHPMMTP